LGVGPLAQAGLDESLGFAVGPRRVGLGADVPQSETSASFLEGKGLVAGTVVRHHALDLDAEACVVGDRRLEEGDRTMLFSSGMILAKATRE
jgi:hypothetical protein